jgi:4-azaleucine resistance transporter AzlC
MIISMSESKVKQSTFQRYLMAGRAAFPHTIPVMAGYVFAGISFGLLMNHAQMPAWLTIVMCITMISGSSQFLAVDLLQSAFNPLSTVVINLMVNSRYSFCGLTLLDRYKGTGKKKPYLIWNITDETFVINLTSNPPEGIRLTDYMFMVAFMDHMYWIVGGTLGALIGELIKFNMDGIGFAMTGMFTCIFLDQWGINKNHKPAVIGVIVAIISLLIFGAQSFMLPAMLVILAILLIFDKYVNVKVGEEEQK